MENHDRTAWLKGGNARCASPPREVTKHWRLALLGAPGVGKGTQADLLSARLGTCHLSTGDVFRAAKSTDAGDPTPALADALACMRRGELVADHTVLEMIHERRHCLHCRGGFLLDGFPRTVVQAEALEKLLLGEHVSLNGVINYELGVDEIVERLAGRRSCPRCKAVFHATDRPPRRENICDHCLGPLVLREDDRSESVRVRMKYYQDNAAEILEFYRERGLLVSIEAKGAAEEICSNAVAALNDRRARLPES